MPDLVDPARFRTLAHVPDVPRSAPRCCVPATRRGHGSAGFFNLLVQQEGDETVLYPHAIPELVIVLDREAAGALVGAIQRLGGTVPS